MLKNRHGLGDLSLASVSSFLGNVKDVLWLFHADVYFLFTLKTLRTFHL